MHRRVSARDTLLRAVVWLTLSLPAAAVADDAELQSLKDEAVAAVDAERVRLNAVSLEIWKYAETALQETQSANALAKLAEQQGFRIERGISSMPTAFIASYGEGQPVIGILGEYDALPRLSQTATPERQARVPDAGGHGCGHNLFGPASLGAANAIRQLIAAGKLKGTIRFYGTPAEEAVGGKTYMARDGVFDDVDVMLSWHPSFRTEMNVAGSKAMVETMVAFHGVAAHASADPWNGRSALDGLELFTHALNMLREHVRPSVRLHYSYVDGGGAPNVVPESASAAVWIRDNNIADVLQLYERMQTMAQGAAMAASVTADVQLIAGSYNMLSNHELAKLAHANMLALGDVGFDEADDKFARKLQEAMGVPAVGLNGKVLPLDLDSDRMAGGSTDVADVSWVVPTIDIEVSTAAVDIPWHSWGVTASSGMATGQKGMHYAARVLATTAVDLFTRPDRVKAIREEFRASTSGFSYHAYLPDGPPPIPGTEGE